MLAIGLLASVVIGLFLLTAFRGAPYVPTRRADLKRAFTEFYPVNSHDFVVDIGSGDGVVLRQAALRGARGLGIEVNPVLVIASKFLNRKFKQQLEVRLGDFWYTKLPAETTIVYTFGESRDIARMYKRVEVEATRLQKQLLFMSYAFPVPGKKPLKTEKSFYLYQVVPLLEAEPQV